MSQCARAATAFVGAGTVQESIKRVLAENIQVGGIRVKWISKLLARFRAQKFEVQPRKFIRVDGLKITQKVAPPLGFLLPPHQNDEDEAGD